MKKTELIFGFSSFFAFGYSLIVTSTLIPIIEKAYNIDHSLVGLAFSIGSIAFLLSALLYGYLLEKFNAFKMILSAILIFLMGNILMFLMNSYWIMVLGIFFINFGGGALEISIPFLIGVTGNGKKGRILNLLHSAFAIGALSSPIFSSLILRYTKYWKLSFLTGILLNIIPLISLFLIKSFIESIHTNYLNKEKKSIKGIINFNLIMLVLALSFYVGYEMNFSSWISTFLYEFRNFNISTAALYPSFLWFGLFLGRTLLSKMPERYGYKRWLIITVLFSILFSVFTIYVSKDVVISAIGTILVGTAFATTYPTIQALIVEKYENNKGIALSIASGGTSIISGGITYLIGYIGKLHGLLYSFFIVITINILELIIVFLINEKK
ncbi:Fucose permease [Marinitoga hydrogenitolerans DSM 16785]|uniref:Fucose permease n=1 Tax=Marinitoga hydrogenitolerans (strain DSM 16785 / JCM 12826 / AT1271) TaxID=1122195 RepID=A0A1M4WNT7_MARH1|nr:MFS transporter [Marinitoga hydrogenitolerans]SHE82909.1 Fucose permease [Marinitoga hydrogenitolerans DSM 16785]